MAVIENAPILVNNWNCSCGYNNPTNAATCAGQVKNSEGKMVSCGKSSNFAPVSN
jgi:hypothetical protein